MQIADIARVRNGYIGLALCIRRQAHALGNNIFHQTAVGAFQQLHLGINLILRGQPAVDHLLGVGTGGLQHSQRFLGIHILALHLIHQLLILGVLGLQNRVVRTHGYGAGGGVAAVQGLHGHGAVAHTHRGNQAVLHRGNAFVRRGPGDIIKGLAGGAGQSGIQLYRISGCQQIQLGLIQRHAADYVGTHHHGKGAADGAIIVVRGGHGHLGPGIAGGRTGTQHQLAVRLAGLHILAVVHRPGNAVRVCVCRHNGSAQLQLVILTQGVCIAVLAQINGQCVIVTHRAAAALLVTAQGRVPAVAHIAYIQRLRLDDFVACQCSTGLYQCLGGLVNLFLCLGVIIHHGLGFLIGLLKGNAYSILIVLIVCVLILLQRRLQRTAVTAGGYRTGGRIAAVIGNGTHGGGTGGHKGYQTALADGSDLFIIALPVEVGDGGLAYTQGAGRLYLCGQLVGLTDGAGNGRLGNGNAGGGGVRKGHPHIVRPAFAEVVGHRTGNLAVIALVLQHIKAGAGGGRGHAVLRDHDLVRGRGPGHGLIAGVVGVQAYIQIQLGVFIGAVGKQGYIVLIEVAGLFPIQINLYIIDMGIFFQSLVGGDQLLQLGVHLLLVGGVGVNHRLGLGQCVLIRLPGGRVIVGFYQLQGLIGINLGLQGIIVGNHIHLAGSGVTAVAGGHGNYTIAAALKGNHAALIHGGNVCVRGSPYHILYRGLADQAEAGGGNRCL